MLTVDELLDALGGNQKVAETLGASANGISNWRMRGKVPARYEIRVWSMALSSGLDWEPAGAAELRPLLERLLLVGPTKEPTAQIGAAGA